MTIYKIDNGTLDTVFKCSLCGGVESYQDPETDPHDVAWDHECEPEETDTDTSPGGLRHMTPKEKVRLEAIGYPREILDTGTGPAQCAEGASCAQCDSLAWRIEVLPFCLDHSQATLIAAIADPSNPITWGQD